MIDIPIRPIAADQFSSFGDILDFAGAPDRMINQGNCGRFHDRARVDFGPDGRAGVSLFEARPRTLPYTLEMVERHPLGSQAFIPMTEDPFLVIVAPDVAGKPGPPLAFRTFPGQAINYRRNVWHGVLTPLSAPGRFAVIDRIGAGDNLIEHWFDVPYQVVAE